MTNAFDETDASCDARSAGAEVCFALVTAGCLLALALRAPAGELGFWVASGFGLATAVVVARVGRPLPWAFEGIATIWSTARLWASLATANLALSAWATDRLALAGLWLPCITAAVLHCLSGRERAGREIFAARSQATPAADTPSEETVAIDQGDRLHCLEWTQTHDAKGLKNVAGVARLTFRPGERQTELHLAFCPSFASTPTFDCRQSGGPDVRIKVTQTMPYGARIEVQRTEPAAWGVVSLEFTATVPCEPHSATPLRRAS